MMSKFKKIISSLLVTIMFSLLMGTSALAGEMIIEKQVLTSIELQSKKIDSVIKDMTSEELQQYLIDAFGATEEAAEFLAQYQNTESSVLSTFPSNPQIGDVYKADPFTIHVAVDASIATLASLILPKIAGPAGAVATISDALAIAGAVLSLGSAVFGNTVQITPSYTYGYNNDGVLGWTPGYMDIKIV